jgi:hypothetical protein
MKIVERDPAAWREVLLGAVLFLTALFALGPAAFPAQSTDRPETPLMRQLRQALRLAQLGDKQGEQQQPGGLTARNNLKG